MNGIFDIKHFSEVDVLIAPEFMGIPAEERHQFDRNFHNARGTDAEVQFRRLKRQTGLRELRWVVSSVKSLRHCIVGGDVVRMSVTAAGIVGDDNIGF